MAGWIAPAAAAAFWAGLLGWTAIGGRVASWPALAVTLSALTAAWLAAPRRVPPARTPLARSGLIDAEPAASVAVAAPSIGTGGSPPAAAALALVGLAALGVWWGGVRDARTDGSALLRLPTGSIELTGTLRADPGASAFGWSAIVLASEARWQGGAVAIHEPVWVNGDE